MLCFPTEGILLEFLSIEKSFLWPIYVSINCKQFKTVCCEVVYKFILHMAYTVNIYVYIWLNSLDTKYEASCTWFTQ